jgi:hypothetical protein
MLGRDLAGRFSEAGIRLRLEDGQVRGAGPAAPPPELLELARENDLALKAALFLLNPPAWVARMLNMRAAGVVTEVRRGGERFEVRPTLEAIAAGVCVELEVSTRRYKEVMPEVEALERTWQPRKVVPLVVK